MGGFNLNDIHLRSATLAIANEDQIDYMDEFTRQSQEDFLSIHTYVRNPRCKIVEFQLELWKYKSKIAYFIDEMEKFTISLNSVVRSYISKKHIILSKAERSDLAQQLDVLIEHLKNMKRNIIDRFRFTNRRCKAMSTRVMNEYLTICDPDENPEYKKILHPELDHHIVNEFIDQCQDLVVCTQKVVMDFGVLECRLRVVQKDSILKYRFTEFVLM